jgi:hypothetical protein
MVVNQIMLRLTRFGLLPLALATGWIAHGQTAAPADAPWPEAYFEIFKLAPGKQEAFIRRIARSDEISRIGGQPPIQMFVHQDGADWDVLLYKPVRSTKPTAEQQAAMDSKRREWRMESGPAYFVGIRQNIAAHTDTKAYGPITAAQWLSRLDKWRADNPGLSGDAAAEKAQ